MKRIELNAELVVNYMNGQLAHDDVIRVEEALLANPNWLQVVEYYKETEQQSKASIPALNKYFEDQLALNFHQPEIENTSVNFGIEEQIIAYTKGEFSHSQAFEFEELLLKNNKAFESYEEYQEVNNTKAFEGVVKSLDAQFEKELKVDVEQATHRFLYPTLIRWTSFAAAIVLLIVATKVFYQSDVEPTYYTLGEETTEGNTQYQEVVNANNVLKNKMDRLFLFGPLVSDAERAVFIEELRELTTPDAVIVVEGEQQAELSIDQFLTEVEKGNYKSCKLSETELEKESSFLFFADNEHFKIDAEGEVLKGENSALKLSNSTEGKLLVSKLKLKC